MLYLLALVPAAAIGYILTVVSRRRALARFGNASTVKNLMSGVSSARNHLKFIIFITAFALAIFAAARPQFGSKLHEEKSEGIEMMIAVDVSNSMLAEDFEPSRLERTKYAIDKLFELF